MASSVIPLGLLLISLLVLIAYAESKCNHNERKYFDEELQVTISCHQGCRSGMVDCQKCCNNTGDDGLDMPPAKAKQGSKQDPMSNENVIAWLAGAICFIAVIGILVWIFRDKLPCSQNRNRATTDGGTGADANARRDNLLREANVPLSIEVEDVDGTVHLNGEGNAGTEDIHLRTDEPENLELFSF